MTERYSMVGRHAYGKVVRDVIFTAGGMAEQAVAKYGKDRVVNATVGIILDDKEQMAVLPTVDDVVRRLSAADFAAYSPFFGPPDFRAAAKLFAFGEYVPDAYVEVVATPGSTGALRNCFWNYADIGDTILVPDWRWNPYDTIATEHLRKIDTYKMFNDHLEFSLDDLKQKLLKLYETQARAIVVFNDPAHNPTGYDMTLDQWRELMAFLRSLLKDPERCLTVFIDAPYIDYAAAGNQARALFQTLTPIPRNMLVGVGYSISKSLTQYGMRTGAFIGVSQDRDVMDEFLEVNAASARAVWTNVPRVGMQLTGLLYREKGLAEKIAEEREGYRRMLNYRASVFHEEAAEVGLRFMPYRSGFFISVPTIDSTRLMNLLTEKLIYVVPMDKGIRIAISGIPARKISGIAYAVQECLEKTGEA
ncbi:MAG: pyridoxal phosphate-dependent aminotransferase [Myxococcota bacterium]